jgi:rod shape-determining protein MreC
MRQQVDQLRSELNLGPLPGRTKINLDVISFDQAEGRVTLDGGSELGIQPDMPVVNGDGLVAIVQTVSHGQCQASLLTSFNILVGGIDASRTPPERGLLSGRGSATLTMVLFNPHSPVATGDEILTGGLSKQIPYGIKVGRVISVENDPDIGSRRATVDPAVNIGSLREVQVLK